MTRVGSLLAEARAAGIDRLDAHLLLAHHLGRPRAWLLAHDDAAVDAGQAVACRNDISERARGVPLAYLIGEREFHGLTLRVSTAVLVPRPDTETLVDWALELLAGPLATEPAPRVLDLGTGSGAIALAVKYRCPRTQVTAVDNSAAALAVAQGNADRLGLGIEFLPSNWFSAVAGLRFELVLANPPYIDADDPHLDALRHEPAGALTPGTDGLSALRRISAAARPHLRPGGWLLLEHGHTQAEAVATLLSSNGLQEVSTRADLEGRPRCTGAREKADDRVMRP